MPLMKIDNQIAHVPSDPVVGMGESLEYRTVSGHSWEGHGIMRDVRMTVNEEREMLRKAKVDMVIGIGSAIGCVIGLVLFYA